MPPEDIREIATRHIASVDPHMASLIARVGPCRLRRRQSRYAALVRAIVAQQLSGQAARTVYHRLRTVAGGYVTPCRIDRLPLQKLRSAGLSANKASYVHELSKAILSKSIRLDRLDTLQDDQVVEQLTALKGIGRWTAEMFLIFVLNRPDVLPFEDVGIQNGFVRVYGLTERPTREEMEAVAAPWRPFRSVGSWFLWRALEIPFSCAGAPSDGYVP